MPANIQLCYICPRCDHALASIDNVTACPSCGLPLGKQDVDPYTPPYTLSEQHYKYLNSDRLVSVLADMPIEKANNIMNDALIIIENVAGKKTRVEGIRELMQMAIRIGEIASAYEKFLQAGGRHHPTHHIKTEQQQQQPIKEIQYEPKGTVVSDSTASPPTNGRGST